MPKVAYCLVGHPRHFIFDPHIGIADAFRHHVLAATAADAYNFVFALPIITGVVCGACADERTGGRQAGRGWDGEGQERVGLREAWSECHKDIGRVWCERRFHICLCESLPLRKGEGAL